MKNLDYINNSLYSKVYDEEYMYHISQKNKFQDNDNNCTRIVQLSIFEENELRNHQQLYYDNATKMYL